MEEHRALFIGEFLSLLSLRSFIEFTIHGQPLGHLALNSKKSARNDSAWVTTRARKSARKHRWCVTLQAHSRYEIVKNGERRDESDSLMLKGSRARMEKHQFTKCTLAKRDLHFCCSYAQSLELYIYFFSFTFPLSRAFRSAAQS